MKTKNILLSLALLTPFCCFAEDLKSTALPSDLEGLIAFIPVISFFLILFVVIIKLRNDKVKLSDLLSEKDPSTGAAANPPPAAPAPATTPTQSVSRFIAFLTALVALTIGISICTFFMYNYYLNPANKLDLSSLTNVIWGLGIGIIPYGANKVSTALKSNA